MASDRFSPADGAAPAPAGFMTALLDALDSNIAVVDADGILLHTNAGWQQRARAESSAGVWGDVGNNYLTLCEARADLSAHAPETATGIRGVLSGCRPSFANEFACIGETGVRWFRIRVTPFMHGSAVCALIAHDEISAEKRAEGLLAGEKRVLELGARGAPLHEILQTYASMVDDLTGREFLSSILLLDADGIHLRHGAAPSLPPAYSAAIDGAAIGPAVGSCGTAAFRKERVIVADIATDPLWADYRDLALSHGLRACWSTPIFSSGGTVLGTFAMYYRQPRTPRAEDLQLIDLTTRTASIVIERHRIEQERAALLASLRESEAHFRTLAEAVPQMVWGANADGVLDYYNQIVYDYTGVPAEELRARGWSSLVAPEEREAAEHQWLCSVRTGEDYETEFRVRAADGRYRWFLVRALPVRDNAGRVTRWCGTCTDIDDKKRAEERLREADRRKDEFLATLAHELRNPLAPIRNSLKILGLQRDDPAVVEQVRDVVDRQVRQIIRLVDDLLDLSRITRGKVKLAKEPIDVTEVVAVAVETSRPLIESRQHQLRIELESALVVEADAARLAQVLANLLNNSAKYTEVGGTIWLEALQVGAEVVVRVRDTGIGISAEMLPRVFDMYVQEDSSIQRCLGGLGLGLPLVRQLVEMHGGTVEAHSAGPGRGSEFVVHLPAWDCVTTERYPTPKVPQLPLNVQSRRILVVDDNIDSAESLALLLGLDGHVVEMVHDGQAAVERALEFRPEILFLDINLPKLDGYGVVEHLRTRAVLDTTLFVAMTGYGDEETRRRTAQAGFHHHLVKPMDLDAIALLLAGLPEQPAAE